jgi:CRP/FNR family transcriptional regulator, cyclic AMP receptor protein
MMIDQDILRYWGAIHRKVEKGRVVFCEGDRASFYYQVVSGRIRMVNISESGKEFIQGLFGPGESFGEPALFVDEMYPAGAVADEETVVLRLSKENFLQLLKDKPEIHFAFTCLLAQRLRQKAILSKEMCCSETAALIGGLIRRFASVGGPVLGGRLRVDLTRQQIADMTGLRVETVIRTIRGMYRRGDLLLEKGKVYV